MRRPPLALLLALSLAPLAGPPALAQAPAPAAAPAAPSPADLLFERSHWEAAPAGTAIAYRYARTSGVEAVFGPSFEDAIRLQLEPAERAETRTVRVEFFTGARRRAAGPFEDIPSNPVLLIVLEHHLDGVAKVLKANPRYLKNAIRAALRDRASVVATTVGHGGREVPAWRVEARPFLEDPQRGRMRGLENLAYRFVVSEAVPGAIVSIEIEAPGEGGTILKETLTHDPS